MQPQRTAPAVAFLDRHAGPLVALAAALLCLPFLRSVWWLADEGIWLHAAQRMLAGEALYRDFFEFYPPLGFLVVSGWTAVFGSSLVAARLLVVLVIAFTAWATFACCKRLSGRTGLSATLTLSWVLGSQGLWTQVSHQWFTSLLSMVALWALLSAEDRPGKLALAGLAAGAATLVTTHRGALIALAGLATLLPRRSIGALALYAAGGLLPLAAILALLWWQGSLVAAFGQVILFPLQHNAAVMRVSFGAFRDLQTTLIVAVYPLIAGLIALALSKDGTAVLRRRHWPTASLFALAGLLGCFPRPDAAHIAFAAVTALPLLAALLASLWPARCAAWLGWGLAAAILLLPAYPLVDAALKAARARRIDTPAGTIAVLPKNGTAELIGRLQALPSGDTVYFYPYDPMLPPLTGRHHPTRLDVLVPQYSPTAQYLETCRQVMQSVTWVVVDTAISRPAFYRAVFPSMRDPSPPERLAFEAALDAGFAEDARYGGFRLLRRVKTHADPCTTLATLVR